MRRAAFLLLASVLTLLALGTVMVFSATASTTAAQVQEWGGGPEHLLGPLKSHGVKVALGLALLGLGSLLDYRWLARHSHVFYALAIIALILVLVPGVGAKVNGSRRWFRADLLPFAFQPAEYAKLAVTLSLATIIARTGSLAQHGRRGFLVCVAVILLPGMLILAQTDFGTFLLLTVLGFSLLVLAGARAWQMLLLCLASVPFVALVVWKKLDYVQDRFSRFASHDHSQQVEFSLAALGQGGLSGVGLGGSKFKMFFLPHCDNDFILSIIGEELGFFGTTAVILLFGLFIASGARIVLGIRDRFGFFLVAGILLTIITQAMINLAVATATGPVKGMPLPFVSAGGSSLVVLCFGVGLILSVARHPDRPSFPLDQDERVGPGRLEDAI